MSEEVDEVDIGEIVVDTVEAAVAVDIVEVDSAEVDDIAQVGIGEAVVVVDIVRAVCSIAEADRSNCKIVALVLLSKYFVPLVVCVHLDYSEIIF